MSTETTAGATVANRNFKTRLSCRACHGPMIEVWPLGLFFRINSFPAHEEERKRVPAAPLTLARCHACGLVQLRHTVDPDLLFGKTEGRPYWYRSGVNESMVRVLRETVDEARALVPVHKGDMVVDIGANDGTLLSFYEGAGVLRVGYEPATNLRKDLLQHVDVIAPTYFPGDPLKLGRAKIITSVAVFYDVEDPLEFCRGVADLLADDGIWVNQLAYLPYMLARRAWDGICHEHLTYYCLSTILPLLDKAGLKLIRVDRLPDVNEGSVRLFITKKEARIPVRPEDLAQIRLLTQIEQDHGLTSRNDRYLELKAEAEEAARMLLHNVLGASLTRGPVDCLGASTKGNTLLQYCQLGPSIVRRAIERSEEKVGRMTVTGIPIVSEEEGRRDPASYLLVLPWHFRDSILARERGRWPMGTKFIFPLPELEVVEL